MHLEEDCSHRMHCSAPELDLRGLHQSFPRLLENLLGKTPEQADRFGACLAIL